MSEKSIIELAQEFAVEVTARGMFRERQRIIDLLIEAKNAPDCFDLDIDALIALIRGETK